MITLPYSMCFRRYVLSSLFIYVKMKVNFFVKFFMLLYLLVEPVR